MARNETAQMGTGMPEGLCAWPGCKNAAEAALDAHPLCRTHFHELAGKNLKEYEARLHQGEPSETERSAITKSLSALMGQTTTVIASAKSLSAAQREQLLALSFSAMELYKQVQRRLRVPRSLPILIYGEKDGEGKQQAALVVNVSKLGACIATTGALKTGETIWIQNPPNPLRAFARIVWAKKTAVSQYLIGIEILDCEDFWELESTSPQAS